MKKFIPIITMILLFSGCNIKENDPVFDYNKKSAVVVETNNNFGLALLKQVLLNEDDPNVMISPTSVSLALGMAYNGAEDSTKRAFEELFDYVGLTREEVNNITKELIEVLTTNSSGNLLEIANSVWYQEGFPVIQGFIDLNTTYYGAEVIEQDFMAADAIEKINNWVSDKTHKKITEIVDQLDPATRMILINALYFNCVWQVEFDKDETQTKAFYNEDGSKYADVEMMLTESNFKYAMTDEFSAVELPYKDEKFSMLLFLPAYNSSLSAFLGELNGENWTEWTAALSSAPRVQVSLPKFKFDYDRSLAEDLQAMGLGIAFTDMADFSGISSIPLLISDVIHKTYIDVNEEGTEAAAVTAVVFETTSVGGDETIVLEFNRPFFFAIRENSSSAIVFAGKVTQPAYEK
ncbi:MAG: serpin family protein [Bacteroidota bacterium]